MCYLAQVLREKCEAEGVVAMDSIAVHRQDKVGGYVVRWPTPRQPTACQPCYDRYVVRCVATKLADCGNSVQVNAQASGVPSFD